jgi:CDP-glucose 4,6-dehydratase
LEPLSGYFQLGAALHQVTADNVQRQFCGGFNFGPSLASNWSVADLVEKIMKHSPGRWEDQSDSQAAHEATLPKLATRKAFHFLKWQPLWDFSRTIE